MADFDAFESAPQDDPAADFLAREQDELKGLDDDNFGGNAGGDYDPFGGSSEQPTQSGYSGFDQDDLGAAPQQYDDYGQVGQTDNYYNGETEDTGYSAISQVDRMRAEPEKIRIWREENARRIEKKDGEEKKRIEEWRTIAKKELDDWYKHHDEQLNKTKENNRESEAAFIADRDETQPGEEWEKICRLCEFNPKNSKNTKDISRFVQSSCS